MRRSALCALLAGLALLAACSGGGDASPGATSADEDRQLNEAAAMLDANSIDLNAIAPADSIDADPIDAPRNESAAQ